MKPTLDEEIRDLARNVVKRLTLKVASNGEIDLVSERIRAGIEAWKRQEPSDEMLGAAHSSVLWDDYMTDAQVQEFVIAIYRAMMSAALRTSETTGE